jgi:multiple sugar transport system ATP-binding protein
MDTTTVYVTHDQTEAMTLGDRVAVMLSGVLQQVGSPMDLYNNPANLFVAGFIGSPGIRPEDFEEATKVDRETQGRGVTFKTKLDLVEAMGAEFYAHFGVQARQLRSSDLEELREDAGGVTEKSDSGDTVVVARLSPESRARSGEPAELWLDATKLHFFDADSGEALTHTP